VLSYAVICRYEGLWFLGTQWLNDPWLSFQYQGYQSLWCLVLVSFPVYSLHHYWLSCSIPLTSILDDASLFAPQQRHRHGLVDCMNMYEPCFCIPHTVDQLSCHLSFIRYPRPNCCWPWLVCTCLYMPIAAFSLTPGCWPNMYHLICLHQISIHLSCENISFEFQIPGSFHHVFNHIHTTIFI